MTGGTGSLQGRRALVCGASSGIGQATALALAARGASITALARTQERLETLMPLLREAGASDARFLVADLDHRPSLDAIVGTALAQHGAFQILVNNTGGPPSGPLLEASGDDLVAAFGRHLLAAHALVRQLLPGMQEAGWGRIVNVISISVREPIANLGVSNTIRGAMASWAKTLSGELPPAVTINNVLPGFTATERLGELAAALSARTGRPAPVIEAEWIAPVPEGRLARPEEIAAAIAFLASDEASYVRGVSLPVDGGRLKGI